MITGIQGKIIDEKGISMPYSTVRITDATGRVYSPTVGVVADANGNYSIGVVKDGNKLGSHLTSKFIGYKDVTVPIDFNKANMDIIMPIMSQNIPEVTVVASKSKYDCEKKGGGWDETTKTCKLPENESWFKKHILLVLGGGILLIATIATIIIVKSKN